MNTIHCDITVDSEGMRSLGKYLKELPKRYSKYIMICDQTVSDRWQSLITTSLQTYSVEVGLIHIPGGEHAKTIQTAQFCWQELNALQADRDSLLIGLGGGVITDLTGFVAGTYMRGIDFMLVPTTLLAMVDASIGGKNGVNFADGKNLIGTFHLPKRILIDSTFLHSLSNREISSGLAEIIKAAVIIDAPFFSYLQENATPIVELVEHKVNTIIGHACKIKSNIIQIDERDQGIRAILNYGHTFGHALEVITGYNKFLHGEAVAIGMSCAAYVSKRLGFITQDIINQQDELCQAVGLPTKMPEVSFSKLIALMKKDKKAIGGKLNLILIDKIGHAFIQKDVSEKDIIEALEDKVAQEHSVVYER